MGAEDDWEGLVVHEVPVDDVEFGEGHGVDEFLDSGEFEEVAGGIDHDSSVFKFWLVLNVAMGK